MFPRAYETSMLTSYLATVLVIHVGYFCRSTPLIDSIDFSINMTETRRLQESTQRLFGIHRFISSSWTWTACAHTVVTLPL